MGLGNTLKKLRLQKKMSQEDFAKMLGINRGTYAQYEIDRRTPDYETLKKIADFYHVSTDYLLGREEKTENKADVDIKELLLNQKNKATWGGQELTLEQRKLLTDMFAIVRDRIKKEKEDNEITSDDLTNGEKKEGMSRNSSEYI